MNIEKEVVKRLSSIYNLEELKKNDNEGYKKEYEKMKNVLSLNLKKRLNELSFISHNTEHGFNANEFLELCKMFDIELSHNAKRWLCNKVDYILAGGCSYRGYIQEREYEEIRDAMYAIDIIENYPEDIEDYREDNLFLKDSVLHLDLTL